MANHVCRRKRGTTFSSSFPNIIFILFLFPFISSSQTLFSTFLSPFPFLPPLSWLSLCSRRFLGFFVRPHCLEYTWFSPRPSLPGLLSPTPCCRLALFEGWCPYRVLRHFRSNVVHRLSTGRPFLRRHPPHLQHTARTVRHSWQPEETCLLTSRLGPSGR